mmetsp:Transcript_31768/g.58311  ORF Transcript_31768/g.58311 Transcript_31768/m.58311 type:complete len:89 (+) Transcript_31768:57-323(+)
MARALTLAGKKVDDWKGEVSLSSDLQFAPPIVCAKFQGLDESYHVGDLRFQRSVNLYEVAERLIALDFIADPTDFQTDDDDDEWYSWL